MALKASQIADWMLAKAGIDGETLTNLKLQKLVYIANGWHLALLSESLFDESVEAWTYGPVVPSVYQNFKRFGAGAINEPGTLYSFGERTGAILNAVWDAYANFSAVQLVAMTHKPGTPWSITFGDGSGKGDVIPTNVISSHYRELANKYAIKQSA